MKMTTGIALRKLEKVLEEPGHYHGTRMVATVYCWRFYYKYFKQEDSPAFTWNPELYQFIEKHCGFVQLIHPYKRWWR